MVDSVQSDEVVVEFAAPGTAPRCLPERSQFATPE